MSIEHKRKAEDAGDSGPDAKSQRDLETPLGREAQAVLDDKIAEGTFSMVQLDDKVLGNLSALSHADQANVLRQFFRTEIPSMKNPSAYLSGIIRSTRAPQRNNSMNSGRMKGSPVGKQLETMYRQGIMKPGDLDEKLMQRIMEEPEELVMMALSLFAQNVPADCRNRSAFFTSQLKIASHRLSDRGGFNGGPRAFSSPGGPRGGGGMMGGPPGPRPGPAMIPGRGSELGGGGIKDYTTEQIHEGVRVDEFHTCSEYARFVAPFAAKELQNQFDGGFALVEILDAHAWRQLAALRPGEALDIVQEIGESMRTSNIRNPNAFFTTVVRKRNPDINERARELEDAVARGDFVPATASGGPRGPMGGLGGVPPQGPPGGGGAPPLGGLGPGGPRGMPPRAMPQPETQVAYDPVRSVGGPQIIARGGPGGMGPAQGGGGMAGRPQGVVIVQQQPGGDGMRGVNGGQMVQGPGGMGVNAMGGGMQSVNNPPLNGGPMVQMQAGMQQQQQGMATGGMQGSMGDGGGGMHMGGGMHDDRNQVGQGGMGGPGMNPGMNPGGGGNPRGAPGNPMVQGYQQQDFQRGGGSGGGGGGSMGMGGGGGGGGPSMMNGGGPQQYHQQQSPQQQFPQQYQQQGQAPQQQQQQQQGQGYMAASGNPVQRQGGVGGSPGGGGAYNPMQQQQAPQQQSYGGAAGGGYGGRGGGNMYAPAASDTNGPGSSQYGNGNPPQYSASNLQYGGPGSQYGGQGAQGGYATGPGGAGAAPNAQGVQGNNINNNNMYGNAMQQGQGGMVGAPVGGGGYMKQEPVYSHPQVNSQPPSLSQQVQNRIKQLVGSSNGEIRFEHFDSAVCSALAKIPVPAALSAIDTIDKTDKRNVQSLQAFLLNTIQQF